MAKPGHDHEHDGHSHHDHDHTQGGLPPHSHGEPTGNAIEKIGFTRSQLVRMCLAGVAAGAAVPLGTQAQAQAPEASRPRTDSYDDPVIFNGPSAYRRFLQKEGIPVYEGGAIDVNKVELKPWKRMGTLGAYIFLEGTAGTVGPWGGGIPPGG